MWNSLFSVPSGERLYYLGIAAPPSINNTKYVGLLYKVEELHTLVDNIGTMASFGVQIPTVYEHEGTNMQGHVHMAWASSNNRLGVLGSLPFHSSLAQDIVSRRRLGLSLGMYHGYEEIKDQMASKCILHLGVVQTPCFGEEGTWIKDVSNDLDMTLAVFMQKYFPSQTHMHANTRRRVMEIWNKKQQNVAERLQKDKPTVSDPQPSQIFYFSTGFSKDAPKMEGTQHIPATNEAAADVAAILNNGAPPTQEKMKKREREEDPQEELAMMYSRANSCTIEEARAFFAASKRLVQTAREFGSLDNIIETAEAKRKQDNEMAEKERQRKAKEALQVRQDFVSMFGDFIPNDSKEEVSRYLSSETLNAEDTTRWVLLTTNAMKASKEAVEKDHRQKEAEFQQSRDRAAEERRLAAMRNSFGNSDSTSASTQKDTKASQSNGSSGIDWFNTTASQSNSNTPSKPEQNTNTTITQKPQELSDWQRACMNRFGTIDPPGRPMKLDSVRAIDMLQSGGPMFKHPNERKGDQIYSPELRNNSVVEQPYEGASGAFISIPIPNEPAH